jgi:hypothetical protein
MRVATFARPALAVLSAALTAPSAGRASEPPPGSAAPAGLRSVASFDVIGDATQRS